jgi:hypothetical protein
VTVYRDRSCQHVDELVGGLIDGLAAGEIGQQDSELVATEPGRGVCRRPLPRRESGELGPGRAEDRVAGLVAQTVVDQFQIVEIHVQDPGHVVGAPPAGARPPRAAR